MLAPGIQFLSADYRAVNMGTSIDFSYFTTPVCKVNKGFLGVKGEFIWCIGIKWWCIGIRCLWPFLFYGVQLGKRIAELGKNYTFLDWEWGEIWPRRKGRKSSTLVPVAFLSKRPNFRRERNLLRQDEVVRKWSSCSMVLRGLPDLGRSATFPVC